MTFFARQEAARRKTRVLLVYYVAAVVTIVCAFYFASRAITALALGSAVRRHQIAGEAGGTGAHFPVFAWDPFWMLVTAGVSFAVIGGGTLFRRASLAGGGAAVARSAGGREITPGDNDGFLERRLLNIVEEAALASGVPVPRVFVLDDESGINAFAAGFSLRDAAVAVTRGALEQLSREELHGVVAHEFSHIKNGDMRLNSWLLGILFGILVTSIAGRFLMRSIRFARVSRNKKGGGGGGVLIVLLSGLALWVIGSLGVLFARLIQASVSRQREFLADASAVQFTRNPAGLAGALKRIGAAGYGGAMRCANRSELSHMLFSSGTKLSSLFASHPPILTRVLQLEPGFTGDFKPWQRQPHEANTKGSNKDAAVAAGEAGVGLAALAQNGAEVEPCGSLPGIEPGLREALTRPLDAAGALYGLLLSGDEHERQRQRGKIFTAEGAALADGAVRWSEVLRGAGLKECRQVVDLAVEGTRQRDADGRAACLTLVRELAEADRSITLFEALLMGRAQRALQPPGVVRGFYSKPLPPAQVRSEAATVLGVMAYMGQPQDDAAASAAWREGAARASSFGVGGLTAPVRRDCTLNAFDTAVKRLDGLSPLFKGELIMACSFVMRADGELTQDETELLSALADLLDMPLPPGNRFKAA